MVVSITGLYPAGGPLVQFRHIGEGMLKTCLLFVAMANTAPVGATTNGSAVLEAVDARANAPSDTWFLFRAVTQEKGKESRTMTFEVQNKGERRLVQFSAPSDMKGTRVLVLSRSQMWVYLPAYRKVRRVASHVKQQGFMGTTYSDEDMSTTQYSVVYDASMSSETEGEVELVLTPKAGAKTGYSKVEMAVRKDLMLPREIRYFNADGTHVKTEVRDEYDCTDNICTPGRMLMTDHSRSDAWTVLEATDRKVNQGVPDSLFSVRNLERGR